MNLIDAKVIKVLGNPTEHISLFGGSVFYLVEVEYIDDGGKGIDKLHFKTLEDAKKVKEGYIFQH